MHICWRTLREAPEQQTGSINHENGRLQHQTLRCKIPYRGKRQCRPRLDFFEEKLSPHTAKLAEGHVAVCAFVNDILNARTLDILHRQNVRFVALRCAGFNQVDVRYASSLGSKITHVPAYSPYAVAEFALALVLALNRRIHRAYNRVRDGNFSNDGLLGFDFHQKTVGIVGTGKIGRVLSGLFTGFGVNLLGYDLYQNRELIDSAARCRFGDLIR